MAGKENSDLFSQLSSNEGSLPLDFDKNTGAAYPSKGEKKGTADTSESGSIKSRAGVEKLEVQRRPTHHVPPPYKKVAQEALPAEPKNDAEPKDSDVIQNKPMENPEVDSVKDKEEIKPANVAVEEVQVPVTVNIPAPVQIDVPVRAPELAAAPAPAPVTPVVTASVQVVQTIRSSTASQIEKIPEAAPAPKRARHPKTPHAANTATAEKQDTSPASPVSHDRKGVSEQKISKAEYRKPANKTSEPEKFSTDNMTAGQLLQEGRVGAGLSIDQVSISTKIKNSFIESLERDDFKNLPASVYVNAYTRSLCSLYNIDDAPVFSLLKKAKGKNLDYTVPEEVIQQLEKGKQVNIVQENKVKRMFLIGFAACFTLAACVLITYYLIHAGRGRPSSSTAAVKPAVNPELPFQTVITAKTLEEDMEKKLMAPHVFTMTSLPLAER